MSELDRLNSSADLRSLSPERLRNLAREIRSFLVESVSKTGGHLGPNLGVVELTIALHRVFDSPKDTLIFDTGHQSYVHKLLTGRKNFARLRQRGGVSGYPDRGESIHDVVANSHASTAISWAEGVARANELQGRRDRHAVAVVGDGALTGGMAWEALNNVAYSDDRRIVIVVNDNGRSYAPTIGGLAHILDGMRSMPQYENMLTWGKRTLHRGGLPGRMMYDALHGVKKGVRDVLRPQGIFEGMGIKYLGPVDGHDIEAMTDALDSARGFGGPVIVHAITEKGRGYTPAESDVADRFHAVGVMHPETGLPVAPSRFGWTGVFADEVVAIAKENDAIVGVTAAMLLPVGLGPFSQAMPERVIDVGIAEQHALTAAAGMAFQGMHPVVALYATFLNRGFDQLLMDVALHDAGVTIVLDRAGITGDDGPSHNGMWDMALLRSVPKLQLAAPRDEPTLRKALRRAVTVSNAPTVVRYPKGALPDPIPTKREHGGVDVIADHLDQDAPTVLVIGIGAFAHTALDVGNRLRDQGIGSLVVNPVWVQPVPVDLVELARGVALVVTIEDGVVENGVGAAIERTLRGAGLTMAVHSHGIPTAFPQHASRSELIAEFGLRAEDIAQRTIAAVSQPLPAAQDL